MKHHARPRLKAKLQLNERLAYWRKWREKYVPREYWNHTYYYDWINYKEIKL